MVAPGGKRGASGTRWALVWHGHRARESWAGRPCHDADHRRGAALILVLWTVGLLAILVASIAFDAHIEARIAGYYRNRTRADYLARSVTDVARLVIARSATASRRDAQTAQDQQDRWYEPARQLADGRAVRFTETLGDAAMTVAITPEEARRNINRLNEPRHIEDWERILAVGGIPQEYWPELIDSFYDWVAPLDQPRLDGAGDDYYLSLDPPYRRPPPGPIHSIGELLLVKGFNPVLLYGGVLDTGLGDDDAIVIDGIADLLTAEGDPDGKVNVNAASRRVLMTLPGIDELVADLIIEERRSFMDEAGTEQDFSFESEADFMARVGAVAQLDPAIGDLITTRSLIYRVEGTVDLHGVRRRVWGIVKGGDDFQVLRWREHE